MPDTFTALDAAFLELEQADDRWSALGSAQRPQAPMRRVPSPTESTVDLTVETERPATKAAVSAGFEQAAAWSAGLEGILDYTEDQLVFTDIVKSPYSSIVDALFTTVVDQTQVKVIAWYDNSGGTRPGSSRCESGWRCRRRRRRSNQQKVGVGT